MRCTRTQPACHTPPVVIRRRTQPEQLDILFVLELGEQSGNAIPCRGATTSGAMSPLLGEARLISENADGADGREGIAAFLGKRKPEFTG